MGGKNIGSVLIVTNCVPYDDINVIIKWSIDVLWSIEIEEITIMMIEINTLSKGDREKRERERGIKIKKNTNSLMVIILTDNITCKVLYIIIIIIIGYSCYMYSTGVIQYQFNCW